MSMVPVHRMVSLPEVSELLHFNRPRSKHIHGQKERQTPFNLTKHDMQIVAVSPLFKLNQNIAKQLNQKQIKILHLIFFFKTVLLLFCGLKKGLIQKIRMLCFVILNLK